MNEKGSEVASSRRSDVLTLVTKATHRVCVCVCLQTALYTALSPTSIQQHLKDNRIFVTQTCERSSRKFWVYAKNNLCRSRENYNFKVESPQKEVHSNMWEHARFRCFLLNLTTLCKLYRLRKVEFICR
jgi:hypothetical protein